jgi:hypothetical protein
MDTPLIRCMVKGIGSSGISCWTILTGMGSRSDPSGCAAQHVAHSPFEFESLKQSYPSHCHFTAARCKLDLSCQRASLFETTGKLSFSSGEAPFLMVQGNVLTWF